MRTPPGWLERVLRRVLDGRDREWITGDLREEYARIAEERGARAANRWYRAEVRRSVVPSLRRRFARRDGGGGVPSGRGLSLELRHAVRSLGRRPLAAALVTVALALAVGANMAAFALVDAVLLRPLPYPGDERIVALSETHPERLLDEGWASVPNALDWRAGAGTLERVAIFRPRSMALTGAGEPLYMVGTYASDGFFEVFGTPPRLGRTFRAEDTRGADVAILSHGLWQTRFAGDASIVGRTVVVDGSEKTVIGVMPEGFSAPAERIGADRAVDIWLPFPLTESYGRGDRSYMAVARVAAGATFEQASADVLAIQARLRAQYPEDNGEWRLHLSPWKSLVVGDVRTALLALWAAMALVFVVACANAANLMVGRTLARRGDIVVRCALGAPRSQVALGSALEAGLLTMAGGVGGVAVAALLLGVIARLNPGRLPRIEGLALDARALVHGALLTGLAALVVCGVAGALAAGMRAGLPGAGVRVVGAGGTRRLRDGLAVAQLALACALLVGSVTAARGFLSLRAVEPGFAAEGVLQTTVALSWDRVTTSEARAAFIEAVLERLRGLPGVQSAAMINSLPLSGSNSQMSVRLADAPPGETRSVALRAISPEYARTLEIPVRGREFGAADLRPDANTALVNAEFERRLFGGESAVGRRVHLGSEDAAFEIVGVLGDVRHYGLDAPGRPELYVAYPNDFLTSKSFVLRTDGDPAALAPAVRAAILAVDPDQPVRDTSPLTTLVARSLALPRFQATALGLLAALAVLLAAVGLFAVLTALVTERMREVALRLALGARESAVLAWVLRRTARLAAPAAVLGLGLALALGRVAEAGLPGFGSARASSIAAALGLFACIALCAALSPALRAARAQPGSVLRNDA